MVKIYEPYEKYTNVITDFRKCFYKVIESKLGKMKIVNTISTNGHITFILNGIPLFAVPAFYYGIGKWTPHISIVNTADIKIHNPVLYNKYSTESTKQSQIKTLLKPIKKKHFLPIGDIDMENDIKEIKVSAGKVERIVNV